MTKNSIQGRGPALSSNISQHVVPSTLWKNWSIQLCILTAARARYFLPNCLALSYSIANIPPQARTHVRTVSIGTITTGLVSHTIVTCSRALILIFTASNETKKQNSRLAIFRPRKEALNGTVPSRKSGKSVMISKIGTHKSPWGPRTAGSRYTRSEARPPPPKKKCTRAATLARKKRGWETEHWMHTKAFGPCCWLVPGLTWSHVTPVWIFVAEPVAFFFFFPFSFWKHPTVFGPPPEPGTEEAGSLILFLVFSVHLSVTWTLSWSSRSHPVSPSFSPVTVLAKCLRVGKEPERQRERESWREREREPKRDREREREKEREREPYTFVGCLEWCAVGSVAVSHSHHRSRSAALRWTTSLYGGGRRTAGCSQTKTAKKGHRFGYEDLDPRNVRPGETRNQSTAWSESFSMHSMLGFPTSHFSSQRCSPRAFFFLGGGGGRAAERVITRPRPPWLTVTNTRYCKPQITVISESQRWSKLQMRTKVVSFFCIYSKSFETKKVEVLPKGLKGVLP